MRIEKNIPLPPPRKGGHNGRSYAKYPWDKMEIGDSFMFPVGATKSAHTSVCFRNKFHAHTKFIARRVEAGIRCWRIA